MTDATELALRALRHRDRSRRELDERLKQAGVSTDERAQVLEDLAATGLISDDRFAETRARSLADRNGSDLLIRNDLRRRGIPAEVAERVIAELETESERAARVFERRGSDARALRYLAGKGFREESLESLPNPNPLD